MKIIPINVDRNVSFSDYRKFEELDQLLVSAIFYTIQGEGPYGGMPAVFLRLAGCNLGAKEDCPFCDTRFDFDKGQAWTVDGLAAKLEQEADDRTRLIVVTGGEPLLQQEALQKLMIYMAYRTCSPWDWQIETNGYFVKPDTFKEYSRTHGAQVSIVISPKVAATKGEYPKAKDTWFQQQFRLTQGREDAYGFETYLKYVVSADPDSPYHTIPEEVIDRCKGTDTPLFVSGMAVYLKSYPEGRISSIWHTDEIDHAATADNYRYAAQYALKHGLRLSYQTHLFAAID